MTKSFKLFSILHACPCDKAVFSSLGYALCDCGNFGLGFTTQEYVGAVGLHLASHTVFTVGGDVWCTIIRGYCVMKLLSIFRPEMRVQ